MEEKSQVELLIDKAERYAKTTSELIRLKAVDKSTDAIPAAAAFLLSASFLLLFFVFGSIGLALLIGEALNKGSYGFFVVAAFYGLIGILVFIFRKKMIIAPLKNSLIKLFEKPTNSKNEE